MTYGQTVTNRVLRQTADLLTAILTDEEKMFRYGSEKLLITICDYGDRKDLEELAERIRKVFEEPYAREFSKHKIQLQISVVELDGRNLQGDKLLQNAALAMANLAYDQKNPVIFYEEEMERKAERMDRIARELRNVLETPDASSFSLH
ncbi:MAG: diguanylate cyclase, partial [Clostridia bacterium]|nr:diguanylate cyclase [Clostridia bacterium]